jgi:hypothetical protein
MMYNVPAVVTSQGLYFQLSLVNVVRFVANTTAESFDSERVAVLTEDEGQ